MFIVHVFLSKTADLKLYSHQKYALYYNSTYFLCPLQWKLLCILALFPLTRLTRAMNNNFHYRNYYIIKKNDSKNRAHIKRWRLHNCYYWSMAVFMLKGGTYFK